MALDVYVGSLTRYYAGDWESIADEKGKRTPPRPRTGSARAGAGRAVRASGKDSERIRKAVLTWRDGMKGALRKHLAEPFDWAETTEAPWFTGRPGWDGFGSLVLWAAYAEQPGLPRPAALPEEWDDDPALVRSNADGFRSRYSHLVRNVELWLPCAFDFTFEGEDVDAAASSSVPRPRSAASSASSTRRPGRWMRASSRRWRRTGRAATASKAAPATRSP